MKTTIKLFLVFIFLVAILPFSAASGCYYNPSGGVEGCRSVITWGQYDSSIKSQTVSDAKSNPGNRYMAWCPTQNALPYVRSDSKLSTCGCPSVFTFNSYLNPGECKTLTCSNCGNYVSYCRPEEAPICGDGKVNKAGEECESDSQCNDYNPNTKDICTSCKCHNVELCQDECSAGETKCSGDKVYTCGNFDADSCKEWGFKQDCYFKDESGVSYKCEADNSVAYKDTTIGFCHDVSGNNDYCDSKKDTVKVSTDSCGTSSCKTSEYCSNNDVYTKQTCTTGTCQESSGKCTLSSSDKITKKQDCGDNSQTGNFCSDDEIYSVKTTKSCVQSGNTASCKADFNFVLVESCGKDGCYDFKYKGCDYCTDEYGNCYGFECELTGKEYRDYSCSDAKCSVTTTMIDTDNDKIDDRCDTCLDKDKDGICDNSDNCPSVSNVNQIDSDKDGKGDACDTDRDGDGYTSEIDCNDWNPKVHPNAKEILNNGIDDDCNADTPDRVADTPRQVFYVDVKTTAEEDIHPGQTFVVVVGITNNADYNLEDVLVTASLPNQQIVVKKLISVIKHGDTKTSSFAIMLPEKAGNYEYLKVTVGDNDYKRSIYRELKITTNK